MARKIITNNSSSTPSQTLPYLTSVSSSSIGSFLPGFPPISASARAWLSAGSNAPNNYSISSNILRFSSSIPSSFFVTSILTKLYQYSWFLYNCMSHCIYGARVLSHQGYPKNRWYIDFYGHFQKKFSKSMYALKAILQLLYI